MITDKTWSRVESLGRPTIRVWGSIISLATVCLSSQMPSIISPWSSSIRPHCSLSLENLLDLFGFVVQSKGFSKPFHDRFLLPGIRLVHRTFFSFRVMRLRSIQRAGGFVAGRFFSPIPPAPQ